MVFSTISAYLDPANWQQQPNYQTGNTSPIPPPPPPPPPPPQPHGAGGAGSIRPGSMADRARMANIPMPETALKCPRCESTNTKFCYFNNYSLSQPRHFCKTCRRYWTRGGALRSVPVGGGCRNKRSSKATSSTTSKSPANSEPANSGSTTSSTLPANNNNNILGGLASEISQLRFMAPLSHYGPGEIGMNYGGISAPVGATSEMNFQIGSNLFGGGGGGVGSVLSSGGGVEHWRLQQGQGQGQGQQFIPNFLGGFDPTTQGGILYPNYYQGSGGYVGAKLSNSSMLSQALVKMEVGKNNNNNNNNNSSSSNNHDCHESNLGRAQFLGSVEGGSDHQWNSSGTAAWTDLSGFNCSSTSNR